MYKCQRSTYLAHHGIGGMKWGKRNGPPYPLNYNDLSAEEKSQAKEKAIRDGNISEANANRSEFSDQELKMVMDRFELNGKLSKLNAAQVKTGKEKMDKLKSNLDSATGLSESAIKAYNVAAKVANSFGGKWTIIDGQSPADKAKSKQLTEKDIKKVLKNPDKYTDKQLNDLKSRMETLNMIKDKDSGSKSEIFDAESLSEDQLKKAIDEYKKRGGDV